MDPAALCCPTEKFCEAYVSVAGKWASHQKTAVLSSVASRGSPDGRLVRFDDASSRRMQQASEGSTQSGEPSSVDRRGIGTRC